MAGIQETKEAVKFVLEIAEAIEKPDIPEITEALIAALPAIKGIKKIPAELSDLDEAEKEELIQYVADEFDLENDKAEANAEKAFKIIVILTDIAFDIWG